jgi:hypothetical protein
VRRAVLPTLLLLLLLCLAAPAQARPKPIVGFGEQNPQIFSDLRWIDLEKPDIRYVMSWDALRTRAGRGEVDLWMQAAKFRNANVLLSFGHSRRPGRELRAPTKKQFTAQFKAFRKRYPWVTTFQAWNEANHGTQPYFHKPKAAAKIYDVIRRKCRTCTVSAPSVLDDGMKMVRWIQTFRKAAKTKVTIWSLHNHIDVNRNTSSGTKLLLKYTRGQVWFTETGGIWNRWVDGRKIKRYNKRTAKRAIRNIFKLQRLKPKRVKRIYVYNWFAPAEKRPRWDSGLIDTKGRERSTYKTLKAQMRKYAR